MGLGGGDVGAHGRDNDPGYGGNSSRSSSEANKRALSLISSPLGLQVYNKTPGKMMLVDPNSLSYDEKIGLRQDFHGARNESDMRDLREGKNPKSMVPLSKPGAPVEEPGFDGAVMNLIERGMIPDDESGYPDVKNIDPKVKDQLLDLFEQTPDYDWRDKVTKAAGRGVSTAIGASVGASTGMVTGPAIAAMTADPVKGLVANQLVSKASSALPGNAAQRAIDDARLEGAVMEHQGMTPAQVQAAKDDHYSHVEMPGVPERTQDGLNSFVDQIAGTKKPVESPMAKPEEAVAKKPADTAPLTRRSRNYAQIAKQKKLGGQQYLVDRIYNARRTS